MHSKQITVRRLTSIPPQAWLLDCRHSLLTCGDNVEVEGSAFFEGAWAGRFGDFGFADCANVFGSGGTYQDGWLLTPPSHTLEAIYLFYSKSGDWFASNSIVFLQNETGMSFPRLSKCLSLAFIKIINGINLSPSKIVTSNGDFYILHHHNVIVSDNGLNILPKSPGPEFDDYAGYVHLLHVTLRAVAENCQALERRKKYELLASLSSGYDSPACAAIARSVGCTQAVTFTTARGGDSDDGTEIGNHLGLGVLSITRSQSVGRDPTTAALYFATGMQAVDLVFENLPVLAGCAFLSGFHGDKVWSQKGPSNSVLARGDLSGSSLGEFRLSAGFVHIPMPFIGALRHASIRRISNSPEMAAYCVGGHYDRPIPRRMAEQAGVPRGLFGQSKKAIVVGVHSDRFLLDDQTRSSIERHASTADRLKYSARSGVYAFRMAIHRAAYRLTQSLPFGRGFAHRTVNTVLLLGRPWANFEHSHPFNALAFHWALAVTGERYGPSHAPPQN